MTDSEQTTVFAGVDGRTDAQLPEWFAAETGTTTAASFAAAIRDLPRAAETTVAYQNPYTDEWVETDRFTAIVEPDRLAAQETTDDGRDPLFHVPSDSYAVINPTDVYAPLAETLRSTTVDGHTLGEVVFGEIRQYRGGGEVHMDIMFDGLSVALPERDDPITMGVSSGYDFFGGHAVYVEGFARDSYCANSIRSLTDRETVRHVGAVDGFDDWWSDVLGQLALVSDDLHAFIRDAQEITVDFPNVPFDVEAFYRLLGFPNYLAEHAASDARANATDPFEIDMWTLHSGATYALTHFFTGKEGTALDGYVRTANDMLFNPDRTLAQVTRAYEEQAAAETAPDGQTDLDQQVALAHLERIGDDIAAKAATFEAREAQLRERFPDLAD